MACRLVNLHTRPLRVDLRGGGVLVLPPGARSPALREELLYDNDHLADWERAGWLRRLPARWSDVRADAAPPAAEATPDRKTAAPPARKSTARKTSPPSRRSARR